MTIERRKISELIAKYELEPNLDDVYVEGLYDKDIVDAAFKELNVNRPVFCIDDIEICMDVLLRYSLTDGNKQRVIALAHTLSLPSDTKVKLLIDRDHDTILQAEHSVEGLTYTKYCDIECVFFTEEIVRKLTVDAAKAKIDNWDDFYVFLCYVTKFLGAVRATIRATDANRPVTDFLKVAELKSGKLFFDEEKLIAKVFGSGNINNVDMRVIKSIREYQDRFCDDEARSMCCGHDFVALLGWLIKKTRGSEGIASSIERIFVLLVPDVVDEIVSVLD